MLDDMKDGRNLVRVDPEGSILWRAKPAQGVPDCFMQMWWDGQTLTAHSWSGYRVGVDVESGGVTVLRFTK
jgi:hypothetical protein